MSLLRAWQFALSCGGDVQQVVVVLVVEARGGCRTAVSNRPLLLRSPFEADVLGFREACHSRIFPVRSSEFIPPACGSRGSNARRGDARMSAERRQSRQYAAAEAHPVESGTRRGSRDAVTDCAAPKFHGRLHGGHERQRSTHSPLAPLPLPCHGGFKVQKEGLSSFTWGIKGLGPTIALLTCFVPRRFHGNAADVLRSTGSLRACHRLSEIVTFWKTLPPRIWRGPACLTNPCSPCRPASSGQLSSKAGRSPKESSDASTSSWPHRIRRVCYASWDLPSIDAVFEKAMS
eukprot:365497-Chlamydomonas_euryale.AAC.7